MWLGVLLLLGIAPALFGADEQELALAIRAQSDFERVELPRVPQLQDTARCTQSQAAVLSVAPRAEMAILGSPGVIQARCLAGLSHRRQESRTLRVNIMALSVGIR